MGPSDSILKAPNSVSSMNAHIPAAKVKILEPRPAAINGSRGRSLARGGGNPKTGKRRSPAFSRLCKDRLKAELQRLKLAENACTHQPALIISRPRRDFDLKISGWRRKCCES